MLLDEDFDHLVRLLSKNVSLKEDKYRVDIQEILNAYRETIIDIILMLYGYRKSCFNGYALRFLHSMMMKEYKSELWDQGLIYLNEDNETYFDLLSYIRAETIYEKDFDITSISGTSNVLKMKNGSRVYFFKEDFSLDKISRDFQESMESLKDVNEELYKLCKDLYSKEDLFDLFLENKKYRWGKNKARDYELLKSLSETFNLEIPLEWYDKVSDVLDGLFVVLRNDSISFKSAKIGSDRLLTLRNIAFYRLAKLLGVPDLTVKSKRCFLIGRDKVLIGCCMRNARGIELKSLGIPKGTKLYDCVQLSNKAQLDLVRLQMLDSIAGQVDRHVNNYLVQVSKQDDSKYLIDSVRAIDNDFSFGLFSYAKLPDNVRHKIVLPRLTDKSGRLLTGLLDATLSRRLLKINNIWLDYLFGDVLCEDEIESLKTRIDEMRKVIKEEKSSGKIVNEKILGDSTIELLLNDKSKNYVKRLLEYKVGNRFSWKWDKLSKSNS